MSDTQIVLHGKVYRKILCPRDRHFDATLEIDMAESLPNTLELNDLACRRDDSDIEVVVNTVLFNNVEIGQQVEFICDEIVTEGGRTTLSLKQYYFIA